MYSPFYLDRGLGHLKRNCWGQKLQVSLVKVQIDSFFPVCEMHQPATPPTPIKSASGFVTFKSTCTYVYWSINHYFFLDSFLRSRSSQDHEATAMIKAQFMSMWDGIITDPHCRIMIVAATNRPGDIDPAILRRLPCQFNIRKPVRKTYEISFHVQNIPWTKQCFCWFLFF